MTVHREGKGMRRLLIFTCDVCGEQESFVDDADWDATWGALKADGWRAHKDDDDEWTHECPDCAS